jgi:hypothetical protein
VFFPISSWFAAFVVTIAIEAPIVVWLLRGVERDLVRLGIFILTANLATHLAVWNVFTQLLLIGTIGYIVVVEAWAMGAEAVLYWAAIRKLSMRRAVAIAVIANLASFAAGRLIGLVWPEVFR